LLIKNYAFDLGSKLDGHIVSSDSGRFKAFKRAIKHAQGRNLTNFSLFSVGLMPIAMYREVLIQT
jgi:hypothetical protein